MRVSWKSENLYCDIWTGIFSSNILIFFKKKWYNSLYRDSVPPTAEIVFHPASQVELLRESQHLVMEPDLIQAVKEVCWDGALKKFIDYTCVYIKIQKHLDNIYIYIYERVLPRLDSSILGTPRRSPWITNICGGSSNRGSILGTPRIVILSNIC